MDDTKIPGENISDGQDFDETSVPEPDSGSQSQRQDDLSDTDNKKKLEELLRGYVGDIPDKDKDHRET
jgi:hypothetical protein